MTRGIVIGAGIAGLATAALLAREGMSVTVVERLRSVGGRAGELEIDGFRFDTGPSWYLMPDAYEHFFGLLGTTPEREYGLTLLDPSHRVFPEGGAPVDVRSGRAAAIKLFDAIEPGAGPALAAYLDSAALVYHLSIRHFLYTTFASPGSFLQPVLLRHLGELAVGLGTSLDAYVDRRFRHPLLRQLLKYPAVFLSTEPARTPALYHLMSHTDLGQGVWYPTRGFSGVVDALRRACEQRGVRIVLGTEVAAIETAGGHVTGVRTAAGEVLAADVVVSCADLEHTESALLTPGERTYSPRFFDRRDPGIGAVLVLAGVRGKIPELSHHNLLLSRDWDEDFAAVFGRAQREGKVPASASIYVSKPSQTDPEVAPPGCENLFVLVPTPADVSLGHGDAYHEAASPAVARIAAAALKQIEEWARIPRLRERLLVTRTIGPADFEQRYHAWLGGAVGPAHTLRQSAFLRGRNASRKVRGLYYAGGSTVPGVGVPMCLISAENVIKRLRGDRSSGPLRG